MKQNFDFYVKCIDNFGSTFLESGVIYGGRFSDMKIYSYTHEEWLPHYNSYINKIHQDALYVFEYIGNQQDYDKYIDNIFKETEF